MLAAAESLERVALAGAPRFQVLGAPAGWPSCPCSTAASARERARPPQS